MATQTAAQRKALYAPSIALLSELEPSLASRVDAAASAERELGLVKSVAVSLYTELDKLSKKSPTHELSDLALAQVNQVISDAKALLQDDPYIDRIKEFVAAGDNPEHRDAVMVLGQVLAGIDRGAAPLASRTNAARRLVGEAEALAELLTKFSDGSNDHYAQWHELESKNKKWFNAGNFSPLDLEDRIRERFDAKP